MSSGSPNHDPALTTNPTAAAPNSTAGAQAPGPNVPSGEFNPQQINLDSQQILSLLRTLPGVFNKLSEQGNLKEDAAHTLSNLSQGGFPPPHTLTHQQMHYIPPNISDPGPSSHPRGPPNLGQLSAIAAAGAAQGPPHEDMDEGPDDDEEVRRVVKAVSGAPTAVTTNPNTKNGGTPRPRARSAAMGSDEWTRQRKDNHKEVERRRRGNINEGINELGRIVPNGTGEKAKGAILSRAVQYIHHLKENEARNIEKWTLEKLLMDQAMGDLQTQLEEMRRLWEEERVARQRAESELEVLRGLKPGANKNASTVVVSTSPESSANAKRRSAGATEEEEEGEEGRAKRHRVD